MRSSFLPIASLLLSIWGFVALTTAIEFLENLATWKLKFVCCSATIEFPENLAIWKLKFVCCSASCSNLMSINRASPFMPLLFYCWDMTTASMYSEALAFIWQMLKQYVLANDFHSNHQFETPYSNLHYFSPIACLLLSTCGFVALITANIS
ncbi:hypothetical protein QYF36_022327 [Acer negundo]|nr:hypothetical protein QYF36_022327 [Acer negundo]